MHHPISSFWPSASQESAPRPLRAPRAVKAQRAARLRLAIVLKRHANGWAVRVLVGDADTRPTYPVFSTFRGDVFQAAAAAHSFVARRYPPPVVPRVWWLS